MRWRRGRSVALALTIALLPAPLRLTLLNDEHIYYVVAITLADVAGLLLIALTIPSFVAILRRGALPPVGVTAALCAALIVVAFAVHPSAQGAQTLFRLAVAAAITISLVELDAARERALVLFVVALTVTTQAALAVAELTVMGFATPVGTFPQTFVLAGYALVGASLLARPALLGGTVVWTALVAVALVPVGISDSRAGALGVALLALPLVPGAVRGVRTHRLTLGAIVIGFGVPALITAGGWIGRTEQYPPSASATRRLELITQTFPLLRDDLLLGIGPGNTAAALREKKAAAPGTVDLIQPPHDTPYLVTLETGLPGGLCAVALALLIGVRAFRTGSAPAMAFLALVPYLLLDDYAWTAPMGPQLLGLWAGASLAPLLVTRDDQR